MVPKASTVAAPPGPGRDRLALDVPDVEAAQQAARTSRGRAGCRRGRRSAGRTPPAPRRSAASRRAGRSRPGRSPARPRSQPSADPHESQNLASPSLRTPHWRQYGPVAVEGAGRSSTVRPTPSRPSTVGEVRRAVLDHRHGLARAVAGGRAQEAGLEARDPADADEPAGRRGSSTRIWSSLVHGVARTPVETRRSPRARRSGSRPTSSTTPTTRKSVRLRAWSAKPGFPVLVLIWTPREWAAWRVTQ